MSFLYAPVGLLSAYDSLDVGCAFFLLQEKSDGGALGQNKNDL